MKIVMISPFFHPRIGGVESHLRKVCSKIVEKGHEITILTAKHAVDLPNEETVDGLRVIRFTGPGGYFSNILSAWAWLFSNHSLVKKADVVHCHDVKTFLWYLPFRFLYFRKPVLITFHGYERIPVSKIMIVLRKFTELLCSDNFCVGSYLSKYYGTRCGHVFTGGVEVNPKIDGVRKADSVIFANRLSEDAGIREYLEALKIVKDRYGLSMRFDIYGDGPLRREMEDYAKANGLDAKFHGNRLVSGTGAFEKVRFVFASQYLSALEGMAGKCVVFSIYTNEFKKDVLACIPGSYKNMIIASSSRDLAEKFWQIHSDRAATKRIAENAFRFAKTQTWEKVAQMYFDAYRSQVERFR